MQLTIPAFTITPVQPATDWQPAPASISVPAGRYRVIITGKAQAASINTGQVIFRPNLNESGGPSASAILYQWVLLQGDAESLGSTGSNGPSSEPILMSTINGVAPTVQPFVFDAIVTVTVPGNLTLIFAPTGEDTSETTAFSEVVIDVTPV